jgi:hypothetical protein
LWTCQTGHQSRRTQVRLAAPAVHWGGFGTWSGPTQVPDLQPDRGARQLARRSRHSPRSSGPEPATVDATRSNRDQAPLSSGHHLPKDISRQMANPQETRVQHTRLSAIRPGRRPANPKKNDICSARAEGKTAAQDERPQSTLWHPVSDSVHRDRSRASVLPRLGLARDPARALTHSTARTTSGPVTRISLVTGELLPRHQCRRRTARAWYEARRSCPLEQYLHGQRPGQAAIQETRVRVPELRHNSNRWGSGAPQHPGTVKLELDYQS